MSFIALAVLALGFISGARQAEATPTGHGHFPPYHRPSHGDGKFSVNVLNWLQVRRRPEHLLSPASSLRLPGH